jgi:hypothetical protein
LNKLPLAWEELHRLVNGEPGYEGAIGVRSAEYPCTEFDGRGYDGGGDCMSDGHYLCVECSHLSPEAPRFTETHRALGERVAGSLGRLDRICAYRSTMAHRTAMHAHGRWWPR